MLNWKKKSESFFFSLFRKLIWVPLPLLHGRSGDYLMLTIPISLNRLYQWTVVLFIGGFSLNAPCKWRYTTITDLNSAYKNMHWIFCCTLTTIRMNWLKREMVPILQVASTYTRSHIKVNANTSTDIPLHVLQFQVGFIPIDYIFCHSIYF